MNKKSRAGKLFPFKQGTWHTNRSYRLGFCAGWTGLKSHTTGSMSLCLEVCVELCREYHAGGHYGRPWLPAFCVGSSRMRKDFAELRGTHSKQQNTSASHLNKHKCPFNLMTGCSAETRANPSLIPARTSL